MKAPDGWRVPDFQKFSDDESKSTIEHISMFLAQLGEASAFDFMKVRNFPLSLTSTTFAWFTSLPSCSIGSWAELEEKFHNHFYNGAHETRLSHLASVRQGRDESVLDFFKRFREIKNRCFHLMISERDLIDLCFDLCFAGLRTSIRPTQPNSVRLTLTRTCTPPLMLRLQLLVSRWTATQPCPLLHPAPSHGSLSLSGWEGPGAGPQLAMPPSAGA